jgi:arabinose-5-phosphate isomerase
MRDREVVVSREPLALAREVVRIEAQAVAALADRLDGGFARAVQLIASAQGKLVVAGVGKSGLLGKRIAATLTSTGTPAVFLHPADAMHGDAGLFARGDVALFLSKSGATEELLALMPYLERLAIPLVALVVQPGSPLALHSAAPIVLGPVVEACPMDLTPTTSVTVMQVVGMPSPSRSWSSAASVPRTSASCIREVSSVARPRDVCVSSCMPATPCPPCRRPRRCARSCSKIMAKRLGITTVRAADGTLAGVVSDGDFKRILLQRPDPWSLTAADIMSTTPTTIGPEELVASAVRQMEDRPQGPSPRWWWWTRPGAPWACCICTTACAPSDPRAPPGRDGPNGGCRPAHFRAQCSPHFRR